MFGFIFKKFNTLIHPVFSAKVVVHYGLKLNEHSYKRVLIQGVLIRELDFISSVVQLLVEVVLLECSVA